MTRFSLSGICPNFAMLAVLAVAPTMSGAQEVLEFSAVSELPDPGAIPSLRGGRPARPGDYPASFYSTDGRSACTSSLIGPRVLLSAAHCMPNGAKVAIVSSGRRVEGTCTHSPRYGTSATARTADYALCLLDRSVTVPFENVNVHADRLVLGDSVTLTGFGCVNDDGTGGGDGVYRVGEASIIRLPSANNNDIVTRGQSALCFGDSGGPAFILSTEDPSIRYQVSVNSRVQNLGGGQLGDKSYLSSLSTADGISFLATWSARHGVRICGLHDDVPNCRPTD